ncbi:MAG: L-threonylcarbamoyladenylate synthase [Gemmatimonadetes bacterium]|nr:L-threonylcarbamoyladenylate synthase [Gemmatimonadota bacterium]
MTILPFGSAAQVAAAIPPTREHLIGGGLIAYPTETVYGLGSRPTAPDVTRLAALKGRSGQKPFLLLVSGRTMAESYGLSFSPAANALAEAFWPGPLTLVLPGGEARLPGILRGPEGGIAVRHTSHPGVARLVAELGFAITSTSANRPGKPPAPGAAGVQEDFAEAVAAGTLLVLDGGVLGNVPPSTVVDCTRPEPRLIREGAIPRAELRGRVGRYAP